MLPSQRLRTTTLFLLVLAALCSPARAQSNDSLVVLFLSQPGVRPASIFTDGFESGDVSRYDATGDGTADLILQRDDDQGNLQDLRVIDGKTSTIIWLVEDVGTTLGITSNMDMWGFADPLGTGAPHALFVATDDVRLIDPRDNKTVWSYQQAGTGNDQIRFLGATDFTDDGSEDLVFYLTGTKQVQVWGDPHVDTTGAAGR